MAFTTVASWQWWLPCFEDDLAAEIHSYECIFFSCSTLTYHVCYLLILGIFHRLLQYVLILQCMKLLVLNLILMGKIHASNHNGRLGGIWRISYILCSCLHSLTASSCLLFLLPVSTPFLCLCKSCKFSEEKASYYFSQRQGFTPDYNCTLIFKYNVSFEYLGLKTKQINKKKTPKPHKTNNKKKPKSVPPKSTLKGQFDALNGSI